MKKLSLVIFCFGVVFYIGCNKSSPSNNNSCTNALPSSDSAALLAFAGDSIIPVKDTTGLYYQILDSGSSVRPNNNSLLEVTYVGKLMNNYVFDSKVNSALNNATLGQLIIGWQIGLPKIGKGGHIRLLIPSAYAWGCTGYNGIPANQPVYFDIWLIDLK